MAAKVPSVKLNTGASMPILGLGTWLSKDGEGTQAIKDAIDVGYRHIDGAYFYLNEEEIGAGIKAKIDEGVVKREELFVVDKLWNTFHRRDLVVPMLKKTLAQLGLSYIDLYLMHWPTSYKEGDDFLPKDKDGKVIPGTDSILDTWRAMEECVRLGLAKAIGVSNFNREQIETLLTNGTTVPACNQVESHPYLTQTKLIEYCKSKGIVVVAYSPLGSPAGNWNTRNVAPLLENETIRKIAEKYKKSVGQILIKFQVQRGIVCIPKSSNKDRIKSNFDIFDFEMSPEDMSTLIGLDCNLRYVEMGIDVDHPDYPFRAEF